MFFLSFLSTIISFLSRGRSVVRCCWVNFQCRGVLLIWIRVGQGPTMLAVGAGGGCLDILSLVYHFSFLSSSLWETARYRLKYCLKGPLSPKQPTNQTIFSFSSSLGDGSIWTEIYCFKEPSKPNQPTNQNRNVASTRKESVCEPVFFFSVCPSLER